MFNWTSTLLSSSPPATTSPSQTHETAIRPSQQPLYTTITKPHTTTTAKMGDNGETPPPSGGNAPPLLDLTIDNITPNTIRINSQSPDARLTYLMARLVTHLHDFARETRLSSAEWMGAIEFLIGCGKICSDVRNVSSTHTSLSPIYS